MKFLSYILLFIWSIQLTAQEYNGRTFHFIFNGLSFCVGTVNLGYRRDFNDQSTFIAGAFYKKDWKFPLFYRDAIAGVYTEYRRMTSVHGTVDLNPFFTFALRSHYSDKDYIWTGLFKDGFEEVSGYAVFMGFLPGFGVEKRKDKFAWDFLLAPIIGHTYYEKPPDVNKFIRLRGIRVAINVSF